MSVTGGKEEEIKYTNNYRKTKKREKSTNSPWLGMCKGERLLYIEYEVILEFAILVLSL